MSRSAMAREDRLEDLRILPYGKGAIRAAARAGGAIGAASAIAALLAGSAWPLLALLPAAGVPLFVVAFFRNPRRSPPAGDAFALAPADGRIVGIDASPEDAFIGGPAIRISIFMSIFDVHANRAPCAGRVAWVEHRPGGYRNAMRARAAVENESNAIGIVRPDGRRVVVRQIAGAIARRIVCIARPDATLRGGELIGMIKFGSRTELYVPADGGFEVRARRGERARAGETVLGVWR